MSSVACRRPEPPYNAPIIVPVRALGGASSVHGGHSRLSRALCGFICMSTVASAPTQQAPFTVHSVHFDFADGQAIRLRDHLTDHFVGDDGPEFMVSPARDELAAFVRNTRPSLLVIFRGNQTAGGTYSVGAGGSLFQVEEREVTLAFDPVTGLSAPVMFRAKTRLPNRVGIHQARLDWYLRRPAHSALCILANSTAHRLGTTWRPMVPRPAVRLEDWVYSALMEWTCAWAAEGDDEKDICDAIIANLARSGLRYGVKAYDIRQMLRRGGGMCSGWYQLFQQMAHCQGVFVHRRCFIVHWRTLPSNETLWCALVIRSGGLGQPHPTHPPQPVSR